MNEKFTIKQNYDCSYSVCDSHNHSLKTFKEYKEAARYLEYNTVLAETLAEVPKSPEEVLREERKAKLKKLFNFK